VGGDDGDGDDEDGDDDVTSTMEGDIPVPVAEIMEGSAWRRSHPMVSP